MFRKAKVSVFVHARCLYIKITRAMYWRLPREVVHVLDSVQSAQEKKVATSAVHTSVDNRPELSRLLFFIA